MSFFLHFRDLVKLLSTLLVLKKIVSVITCSMPQITKYFHTLQFYKFSSITVSLSLSASPDPHQTLQSSRRPPAGPPDLSPVAVCPRSRYRADQEPGKARGREPNQPL